MQLKVKDKRKDLMNLSRLFDKYKDVIPYLFFGVCTTLVNMAAYWFFAHPAGLGVMPSTVIAWVLAVLFAYLTNRKWVFHSEAHGRWEIAKEAASFFAARLATGILDWACMLIFADWLMWNDMFVKAAANIIVIILNYVASKLLIFKK